MARKKNYKKNSMTPVWIVLMIVVSAVMLMVGSTYFGSASTTVAVDEQTGMPIVSCDSETTPDFLIKAYDVDNVGTAITESFIYRKVGDLTWSAGTLGTELTDLIAYQEYEYVLGITASDFTDNAYGEKGTFTVACKADDSIEKAMYNDEIETSLTATFYNRNADASYQTFTAGSEYIVSVEFLAGADEYFGNPTIAGNNNVLILKLNSTEWDKPNKVYLADGTELSSVEVPNRWSEQASDFTQYAYQAPVITDVPVKIFLSMNADDTNAPTVDGTAYIYASNYFVSTTGAISYGVETDEDAVVGTDTFDSVTLDFTA